MQVIKIGSNLDISRESTLAAANSGHDSGYPSLPSINTAKSMDFFLIISIIGMFPESKLESQPDMKN